MRTVNTVYIVLERLAALVPRPEKNLLIYRGLLAPNHKLRSLVVRHGRKRFSLDAPSVISNEVRNLLSNTSPSEPGQLWLAGHGPASDRDEQPRRRLNYSWATLMKRAFEIDVLQCPRPGCSGRLRFIACITEPAKINSILSSINTSGSSTSGSPSAVSPDSYEPGRLLTRTLRASALCSTALSDFVQPKPVPVLRDRFVLFLLPGIIVQEIRSSLTRLIRPGVKITTTYYGAEDRLW